MKRFLFLGLFAVLLSGCGYTTKSLLPEDVKSVHVPPTVNAIDLTEEVSDKRPFRVYRPGLEVDITNAVIDRFIFDGNLRVSPADRADAQLDMKLMDYRRDALRFSPDDDMQEYRLTVSVDVRLFRKKDNSTLWAARVYGDSSFFLAGPRAVSEDEATREAVEDLARRVVDRTIELW